MPGSPDNAALAHCVRRRYGRAAVAANLAGALVVFLFLAFALPTAATVHHKGTALAVNAAAFLLYGLVAVPVVWRWSAALWRDRLAWLTEERDPTDRELALTLRFPLSQQGVSALTWCVAAVLFGALNLAFSLEVAGNAVIGIALGGLVTCALGFLLGERILRPVTALALNAGVPPRPQLPGVAARTLLSWTLGSGVILLGLGLIGSAGLHERRFTVQGLSIAILVLSAIGIVVGIAVMAGLARSLADPIESLRRAVAQVERGDFDHEVPVDDGSEVGLLQAGFNRMIAGLRERERMRDLFGRQVGEEVVRHALDHGVSLGGESRRAAVLFVDVVGSTAIAHSRDPADVVTLLNAFFAIVVDVVAEHGGWVNKFQGDAALCVFGAPLEDADAATHALAAARDLRARLRRNLAQVDVGIGVSAGPVVAGHVGAARRFEYTVIGDPVNEAARLTELAKATPGRVLASAAALGEASARELELWATADEVQLRGRGARTLVSAPRDPMSQRQPAAADR